MIWYSLSVRVCAGVDPHGVQVLDGADDDAVVLVVPHHLHLVFLPTQDGLLDQQLAGGRQVQAALADLDEFLVIVGDAATAAAHGEGGADNGRETQAGLHLLSLLQAVGHGGLGHVQADLAHRLGEQVAVLGLVDGLAGGADHLDAVFLQHPLAHQVQGRIEGGLPTHGGQQGVRALFLDDALQGRPVDRLDVDGVGHLRIGHDGGRVGIHQDDPKALFPQGLAGLGAGIVELAGLADHNGTGADDHDALYVGSFGHNVGFKWPESRRETRALTRVSRPVTGFSSAR
jgi:hypothetical protein